MINLWGPLLFLLSLAVLILVAAYRLSQGSTGVTRRQLNRRLYMDRQQELTSEAEQGLTEDSQALIVELQQNLLDDAETSAPSTVKNSSMVVMLPAVAVLVGISLLLYGQIGDAKGVKLQQQRLDELAALSTKVMDPQQSTSAEELRRFAQGLRAKLQNESEEPMGWLMLARTGQVLNDLSMMLGAAQRGYALAPENQTLKILYIQGLYYTGEPGSVAQAQTMIQQALSEDPQQLELWSIYAMMALDEGQFELAIERWQQMLPFVEEGSERAQTLKKSIAFAQQRLESERTVKGLGAEELPMAEGAYNLKVSLAPEAAKLSGGTLFVFAKAVQGSPVPIAARRIEAPEFPLQIQLSDADSMLDQIKLSDQLEFMVTARWSADASPQTLTGDWQGVSQHVSQGDSGLIEITIDSPL